MGGEPKRRNQRWRCSFHEERGHRTDSYWALKLNEASVITKVLYPSWLSNTIIVKKKSDKWKVCVDFTSLNRAYPKDCFPLPKIDQLVDYTSVHARMSILDAYRGYHQIAMHKPNQEKTAFITLSRHLLLQSHALWFEECWGHTSENDH